MLWPKKRKKKNQAGLRETKACSFSYYIWCHHSNPSIDFQQQNWHFQIPGKLQSMQVRLAGPPISHFFSLLLCLISQKETNFEHQGWPCFCRWPLWSLERPETSSLAETPGCFFLSAQKGSFCNILASVHWSSTWNQDQRQARVNSNFILKLSIFQALMPVKFSIFCILAIIRYCQKIQAHWSFTFPFQASHISHYEILSINFFLNQFVLPLLPFPPNAIWSPNFTVNKLLYIHTSLESISALSGFGWILAVTQEHCSLVRVLRAQILGSNSNPAAH